MKTIYFSVFLLAILSASGCVSSRPPIDLSGSIYSRPSPVADKPQLTVVEIINKAPDAEHKFQQVFASALVPISVPEKTKNTVEADLRKYFEQRTKISETANKSLRVVIHKAESYLVSPAIETVAFVNIFHSISDPDTEFSILLKINIEVEENGKVISTYFFDDEIRIRGKYKGWERQGVSYQKLIKKYRNRLFRELDFYFLGRYL